MPGAQSQQLAELIALLEASLRQLNLWQENRPPAEAFVSEVPFFYDTMHFPQWLQFVFLERMQLLLASDQALPTSCAIAPYAQEYFRNCDLSPDILLAQLQEIDRVLTRY